MVRKSAVDGAYQDAVLKPIPDPGTFGGRKQQETQIAAVGNEVAETGGMPNVTRMTPPQPMNIAAPTNRGLEPITEGVPIGPGGNGVKPVPTDTVFNFLTVGYEMTQDPIFQELLIEHQSRNEPAEDVGEGNAFGTILGA
tara:strand:- start:1083 stop:1502 length:420 start_codon:yes stop_codon:yes gene_type:complete